MHLFQLQVHNISPLRVLKILKNRFFVLTVFIILLVATEDIHVAHVLQNFFRLTLTSPDSHSLLLTVTHTHFSYPLASHDYGLVCACQSSRQRHYFLDSICSALITRELRGPKMAGCSILEFSFVSSESGA